MSLSPINFRVQPDENKTVNFRGFQKALKHQKHMTEQFGNLEKRAKAHQKNTEEACEKLEKYVESHPNDISARRQLSELKEFLGY